MVSYLQECRDYLLDSSVSMETPFSPELYIEDQMHGWFSVRISKADFTHHFHIVTRDKPRSDHAPIKVIRPCIPCAHAQDWDSSSDMVDSVWHKFGMVLRISATHGRPNQQRGCMSAAVCQHHWMPCCGISGLHGRMQGPTMKR